MEKLSNDDLVLIFDFLDRKDLINTWDVCMRWSTLISNSSQLSGKFILAIDCKLNEAWHAINEAKKFAFRRFELNHFPNSAIVNAPKIVKVFSDRKENIEELTALNCEVNALKNLLFRSEAFLNLRSLTISECECLSNIAGIATMNFSNLKSLKIFSSLNFIIRIEVPQLEELEIEGHGIYASPENYDKDKGSIRMHSREAESLNEILKNCENLKHMKLKSIKEFELPTDPKFKLKTFEILKCNGFDLKIFLPSQKECLKVFITDMKEISDFVKRELNLDKFLYIKSDATVDRSQSDYGNEKMDYFF